MSVRGGDRKALDLARIWEVARAGDYRAGSEAARLALADAATADKVGLRAELHLIRAFCAMRQGVPSDAVRELDAATEISSRADDRRAMLRIDIWRAELAYFQGRYSNAVEIVDRALAPLKRNGDRIYVAFALRIRIAVYLARADYESIASIADHALRSAAASGDDYVMVQILNVLGAFHFDRATSMLKGPHARAHLTALDLTDTAPMENEALAALRLFERAHEVAERAHYRFAAWYVAGNIERLEIVLGRADRAVPAIRKRLVQLQSRGAKYDEIVTRSNLAWGLRTLGRYREALHELDVALQLARDTGTFNVLLEFLEYDRSIVLHALGDAVAANASYRRYLNILAASNRRAQAFSAGDAPPTPKRPLEPYLLKRADQFVLENLGAPFTVASLAQHCGVSWRTLEKVFVRFRGLTPVAHIRNLRLDHARVVLEQNRGVSIAAAAARCGFGSSTTFALEYRKRFGVAPSRDRRIYPG